MVVAADVYTLIEYMSQVLWMFVSLSVASVLVLRWTQPDVPRPIRVPLVVPVTFLAVCVSIVAIGAWSHPWNTCKAKVAWLDLPARRDTFLLDEIGMTRFKPGHHNFLNFF